jgi:hypothetical protein
MQVAWKRLSQQGLGLVFGEAISTPLVVVLLPVEHPHNCSVSVELHEKLTEYSVQKANILFDLSGVYIGDKFVNRIFHCKQKDIIPGW